MPKLTKAAAKAELKRRQAVATAASKKPWDPQAILYPGQLAVFNDPTPDRALSGTRQLGKTTLAAVCMIDAGLTSPGSSVAYVDLDIEHAEKVLAREIAAMLERHDVPAKFIDGELRFENGSRGYLFSGRPHEIEKLQGLKLSLLIVDEAQDGSDLQAIVTMVRPALVRFGGRLLFMGIPGRMKDVGPWWDILEGKASHLWGQHRGDMRRNPYLSPAALEKQIENARAELGATSPDFLRHWMGLWPTTDNALRVYRYLPDKNGFDGAAPPCRFHSLGLDPGGVSSCEAVIVVGHGNADGMMYVVDEDVSEPREGGGYDVTGERVGPLDSRWRCEKRYFDYGSAQKGSLTLRYRQDQLIQMEAVPGKDREGEINRINRLFEQGRLFVRRGSKLERCLLYACWDSKTLAGGRTPDYDAPTKRHGGPNEADALRAAMFGVEGYVEELKAPTRMTDVAREAAAIEKLKNTRPKAPTPLTAADVINGGRVRPGQRDLVGALAAQLGYTTPTRTNRPPTNTFGPIR